MRIRKVHLSKLLLILLSMLLIKEGIAQTNRQEYLKDSIEITKIIKRYNLSDYDEATHSLLMSAMKKAQKHHLKKLEADALRLLGKYELAINLKYNTATAYLIKSLSIYDSLKIHEGSAASNLQLGIISYQLQSYNEAIDYFNKVFIKENTVEQSKATAHYLSALSYSELNNFKQALENFDIALKLYSKLNNHKGVLMCEQFIGKMYINNAEYNKAIKHLKKIIEKHESPNDSVSCSPSYAFLSTAYLKINDYKNAIKYGEYAFKFVLKEEGNNVYLMECVNSLYQAYHKTGNIQKAFFYLNKLHSIKDAIYDNDILQETSKLKSQYEYIQKQKIAKIEQEKKDIITAQEINRQKVLINSVGAGFLLMLLFTVVFYKQRNKIRKNKQRSDELLLNILPLDVAEELKIKGSTEAKYFEEVTVIFTDFKDFTHLSEQLSATELVELINEHFSQFDIIMQKYGIEKIKTIGDAYMAVGGLPVPNDTHARNVVLAAIEIQEYLYKKNKEHHKVYFEARIGIHTGPVVAGVVGLKKFSYDVWGDTVNTASRIENSCEVGRINISETTYALLKDQFNFIYRGKIEAKGKGQIDMYYLDVNSSSTN